MRRINYYYATARVGVSENGQTVYHQKDELKTSAETKKYSNVVEWN